VWLSFVLSCTFKARPLDSRSNGQWCILYLIKYMLPCVNHAVALWLNRQIVDLTVAVFPMFFLCFVLCFLKTFLFQSCGCDEMIQWLNLDLLIHPAWALLVFCFYPFFNIFHIFYTISFILMPLFVLNIYFLFYFLAFNICFYFVIFTTIFVVGLFVFNYVYFMLNLFVVCL